MAEKGTCRVCNRPTKLTAAGLVAPHGTGRRRVGCNGAGHSPAPGTRFATTEPARPVEQPEPAREEPPAKIRVRHDPGLLIEETDEDEEGDRG